MATWFAQNSSVNIDSVNQWNSAANGSGSWLTWASLDPSDILVANGKTSITINVNVTCAQLTTAATGGTAGGGFILADGVTVTASLVTGTTNVITFSANAPAVANIIGNQTAAGSQFRRCILHSGSGTLNMTGNLEGGSANENNAVELSGSGVLNVVGNLGTVAAAQSGADTIRHSGTGTINVTGNITATMAAGISRSGTGAIYITGAITGGSGGSTGAGILSTTTALIKVIGTLTAGTLAPAVSSTGTVVVCGNQVAASNGRLAVYAPIVLIDTSLELQYTYRRDVSGSAGTARTMYTGGVNLGQPTAANVRLGTTFGASSEYTGTLAVPSPTLVAIGVATDNTIGSYNPSVNASDIRNAIGLASANLDTQLSGISNKTTNLPSDPADQSLVEAAITSAVNSISTLIDSLPTNAELATALAAADDAVLAAIAALNNLSAAQVNAEILDVLSVDTFGELSAPPAATSSLKDKITWLFMWAKNKATETSTQRKLYADNSTTVVSTETVSDDGTTFTKTKAS